MKCSGTLRNKLKWPKVRSWGWYATLLRTPWFCIKILKFNKYGELSYQIHNHRNELWIFLWGYGAGLKKPDVLPRPPGQMKYRMYNKIFTFWNIPKLNWHTFRAFGNAVYVLEIQYGSKVTEQDIERK